MRLLGYGEDLDTEKEKTNLKQNLVNIKKYTK